MSRRIKPVTGSDTQTDSQKAEAVEYRNTSVELDLNSPAADGHTVWGHCCCDCNGRDCDVCIDKVGHKTFLAVKTCAARADETARPAASVANNNTRFGFNTVYCRGIFTDDDDDDSNVTPPPNHM